VYFICFTEADAEDGKQPTKNTKTKDPTKTTTKSKKAVTKKGTT
jgi:hypothetical protein